MGARMQSDVSGGTAAKKGSVLNQEPGLNQPAEPVQTPMGAFLQGHEQKNFAAVASNEKGANLRGSVRDRGARVEGLAPLSGHLQQNFAATSAESGPGPVLRGFHSPKRSPSKKTAFSNPAVMD